MIYLKKKQKNKRFIREEKRKTEPSREGTHTGTFRGQSSVAWKKRGLNDPSWEITAGASSDILIFDLKFCVEYVFKSVSLGG